MPADRTTATRYLLLAGLVVATLDILYACLFWGLQGVPPTRILQSIAAGLLGPASSLQAGAWSAALGLLLHYLIAQLMAAAYFRAARWLPSLRQRPWTFGALYGLALYAFMNYLVVPLSAAAPGPRDPAWVLGSIIVHMLLVGVPIALFARRALLPAAADRWKAHKPAAGAY